MKNPGPVKKPLIGLAAVVLVAAIAVAAVPSLRALVLGVPLRYEWKAGQESTTRTLLQGKVKIDLSGMGLALPPNLRSLVGQDLPFKVEMKSKQRVKSVAADGTAEVEVTPLGTTVELSFQGRASKEKFDPQPPTIVHYDARGALVAAARGSGTPQERLAYETLSSFGAGTLPGDRRRPGSAWTQKVDAPFDIQQFKVRLLGESSSRLAGVESKDGATVANIATDEKLQVELMPSPLQALSPVKLNGTVTSSGNRWFDWSASRMRGGKGQGTIELKVDAPGAAGARVTGTYTTEVESD